MSSTNSSYTYTSPHQIYSMAFSPSSSSFRLALGSFIESPNNNNNNRIDVIDLVGDSFVPVLSIDHHPYPSTKLMFHPSSPSSSLLASSSDSLRIYSDSILRSVLTNTKSNNNNENNNNNSFSAPLTSFDWNPFEPRRIATSSIDTTCTIWDVEASLVETQLIAHDKEVYDIAWGEAGIFASVSADASVRIFDLRDKEHSTIVYETDTPLLRVAWNRADPRYLATVLMDSSKVVVLDIRSPAMPVAELSRHRGCVNAVAWAPRGTGRHLCSAGDDGQALVWEVPEVVPQQGVDPLLVYSVGAEINQMQWSAAQPDWIGIAFADKVQLLRV